MFLRALPIHIQRHLSSTTTPYVLMSDDVMTSLAVKVRFFAATVSERVTACRVTLAPIPCLTLRYGSVCAPIYDDNFDIGLCLNVGGSHP